MHCALVAGFVSAATNSLMLDGGACSSRSISGACSSRSISISVCSSRSITKNILIYYTMILSRNRP